MSDLTLDVDNSLGDKALSFRERLGIRILLVIFGLVYPAKYSHKVDDFVSEFSRMIRAEP